MTLLFALLTLAVLGVIAAVAAGKIAGGLEEPSTSLPSRGLPEGPVTPEAVDEIRFSPALRGYRMEEVDDVLDRLGSELARRDREILQLSQELRLAERTYLRRAAGAAATPEWTSPVTGSMPVTGGEPGGRPDPLTGSVPLPGPYQPVRAGASHLAGHERPRPYRGDPYPDRSYAAGSPYDVGPSYDLGGPDGYPASGDDRPDGYGPAGAAPGQR